MKNTIVVNLLGGPGLGKSTTMAALFAKLKQNNIDCEMSPEFAKDCVWENRKDTFNDQIYLFGKQQHRLFRLKGKVDVVITDSPIILNVLYGDNNPELHALVLSEFNKYNNMNFFLDRKKLYNPNGRNQTEDEAKALDIELKALLDKLKVEYIVVPGDQNAVDMIYHFVMNELNGGGQTYVLSRKEAEEEK